MPRTIVGIDVGTTKVCTLIGQVGEEGGLRITGVGIVPSQGVHKGVITDLEKASRAIGESVQKAESVSGHTVVAAYVGVGGAHIASRNSRGMAAIGRGDRPVDRGDIERAMEAAQAITMPHNRRIIHAIPREFVIDDQGGIRNPLGLMGFRLEVEAHIVTGAMTCIRNLIRCIQANQIEVLGLVLQPLASSRAVLTEEEMEMGVTLLDMGGGTLDMAIYAEGSVIKTGVIGLGGWHITKDIAVGLGTSFATAEDIKVRYAHVSRSAVEEDEVIEISTFGDESLAVVPRGDVCDIVGLRTEEMLDLLSREIKRSGLDSLLPAGVVMTGGTANLRGVKELAKMKLGLPVRIGTPTGLQGLMEAISGPAYATAVGLLLWGKDREDAVSDGRSAAPGEEGWYRRLWDWLQVLLPRSQV
ncbi:MAG: cell division protein FtsA [Chloroflexota bacterium]|nr:cell division protein FtsA [Chloroflexota bacterium]